MTPEFQGKNFVIPEILITNPDGTTEIIDAKMSVFAPTYKDLVIYPEYADKVTFWALYGSSEACDDLDTLFE
jgi:hypothetical protein